MSFDRALSPADEIIVRRAVRELRTGMTVNLGIGMPTYLPRFLDPGMDVVFHSENGFTGMGPPLENGTPDHEVIDAGVCPAPWSRARRASTACCPSPSCGAETWTWPVLGAFEVSVTGDLANWKIPGSSPRAWAGGWSWPRRPTTSSSSPTTWTRRGGPSSGRSATFR